MSVGAIHGWSKDLVQFKSGTSMDDMGLNVATLDKDECGRLVRTYRTAPAYGPGYVPNNRVAPQRKTFPLDTMSWFYILKAAFNLSNII